jgi:hypothetical protein
MLVQCKLAGSHVNCDVVQAIKVKHIFFHCSVTLTFFSCIDGNGSRPGNNGFG